MSKTRAISKREAVGATGATRVGLPARRTQAGIPRMQAERDRLRKMVFDHVQSRRLVPPLSFGELRDSTADFLAGSGVSADLADFVSILLNNEVWRDVLAAVPYDRRLLLLPRCLRNAKVCAGVVDEFGLVCRQCGACPIAALQTEAETLGYAVLVAEGTTVVLQLIEAGRIDAVVGVSCMEVLEKAFQRGAGTLPGMAIPLLVNGCAGTAVDLDWVWEAIHLSSGSAKPALDLDALRREVEAWFTAEALASIMGPSESETERIGRAWLAKSGKRWRPFLAAATFRALSDGADADTSEGLKKLAVAVECFHKASLVHDDIEDEDETRYGEKTLHVAYGVPVAVNAGDLLLGEGYRLIGEIPVPAERRAEMLRVAADGHCELCVGQGKELCWSRDPAPLTTEQVLNIFCGKTAPAFRVALLLGAIGAGMDGEVREVLNLYSRHLGIAYQIRDDLNDAPDTDRGRKLTPSVLMAVAHENATGAAKTVMERVWRKQIPCGEARQAMVEIFAALRVREQVRQLLDTQKEQAVQALRPLHNASLKRFLRQVVEKMFEKA